MQSSTISDIQADFSKQKWTGKGADKLTPEHLAVEQSRIIKFPDIIKMKEKQHLIDFVSRSDNQTAEPSQYRPQPQYFSRASLKSSILKVQKSFSPEQVKRLQR